MEVRLSFSAFGQRRNAATLSGNPTSGDWTGITNTTRHGFTSQEMLDNLNLVQMNGRVYDQVAGQFTSPDPFIDGPGSTQGWNRYAYVHNNPLSYTDPSGFQGGSAADGDRDPGAKYYTYNEFIELLAGNLAGLHGGTGARPRPDRWQSRGWGSGDSLFGTAGDPGQLLPIPDSSFPGGTPMGGAGSTAGGTSGPDDRALPSFGRGLIGRYRSVVDGPAPFAEQLGRGTRQGFDNLVTVLSFAVAFVPGGEGVLATRVGTSAADSTSRALVPYFPTNSGFLFAPVRTFLQPGQLIDRFGGSAISRFFSLAGTAAAARSLPPATAGMELRTFEVLKALEVDSGLAAPAFGQLGLGTQYRTTLTLQELIEQGFIREVR